MSSVWVGALLLLAVLIGGARIPLTGWRRGLVILLRAWCVLLIWVGLMGHQSHLPEPYSPQVIFAADLSDSMDARQREWMAQRLTEWDAQLPEQTVRSLRAFGADSTVLREASPEPLGSEQQIAESLAVATIDATQSDLESGLLSILRAVPRNEKANVVVISDGMQTTGDVGRVLAPLQHLGIRVFPVAPPRFESPAMEWLSLSLPPQVNLGQTVPVHLLLRNPLDEVKQVSVAVKQDGVVLAGVDEAVVPGWHSIALGVPAAARGALSLEVTVDAEGEFQETRRAYTHITGPPQVLWVGDQVEFAEHEPLAQILRQRQVQVAFVPGEGFPAQTEELQAYDAVIFYNAARSGLNAKQQSALRSYVAEEGGGLVFVGLGGNPAEELKTELPMDALLPVRFEAKGSQETKRRLCLMMLIDRSHSMFGLKMKAVRRAPVSIVNQLMDEDLVGVLTFDKNPYVVTEIEEAGTVRQKIEEDLSHLFASGGTDMYPALGAARRRLMQQDTHVRHVIAFTDGKTSKFDKSYEALMQVYRRDNITLSVMTFPTDPSDLIFLKNLTDQTGGRLYVVDDFLQLPQLVIRDTNQALERLPFAEGLYATKRAEAASGFADFAEFPSLRGFWTATAKPGASVELEVQGGEEALPLLARWNYGRGRVSVFTSDAQARWASAWLQWSGFDAWWAEVFDWTLRNELSADILAYVEEPDNPRLVVEGRLSQPTVALSDGSEPLLREPALVKTGPWRWETPLSGLDPGWYRLTIQDRQAEESAMATRWIKIGRARQSGELLHQAPDMELLRILAESTGGRLGDVSAALAEQPEQKDKSIPLAVFLIPGILILLLAEVALRRGSQL